MAGRCMTTRHAMTGKERIMASLRGEETDHVSWAPLIDPYYTTWLATAGYGGADAARGALEDREGLWSEETDALDIPYAIRLVGGDVLERHSPTIRQGGGWLHPRAAASPGAVKSSKSSRHRLAPWRPSAVTAKRDIPDTSANTRSRRLRTSRFSSTLWSIPISRRISLVSTTGSNVIGKDGIPTSDGPQSPIQHFYMFLCGVQTTTYLLLDHPAGMAECFSVMHQKHLEQYRWVCESPTDVVIDYENTSSTVMSPAFYRQYSEIFHQ